MLPPAEISTEEPGLAGAAVGQGPSGPATLSPLPVFCLNIGNFGSPLSLIAPCLLRVCVPGDRDPTAAPRFSSLPALTCRPVPGSTALLLPQLRDAPRSPLPAAASGAAAGRCHERPDPAPQCPLPQLEPCCPAFPSARRPALSAHVSNLMAHKLLARRFHYSPSVSYEGEKKEITKIIPIRAASRCNGRAARGPGALRWVLPRKG